MCQFPERVHSTHAWNSALQMGTWRAGLRGKRNPLLWRMHTTFWLLLGNYYSLAFLLFKNKKVSISQSMNKYMHQSFLIKLTGQIENLHQMTELKLTTYIDIIRFLHATSSVREIDCSGHWHQRFERALSWYMVTWCNLSSQKCNTAKWVWFQIPSHTSLI